MQEQDWKKKAVEKLGLITRSPKFYLLSWSSLFLDKGIQSKVQQITDKREVIGLKA